MYAYPAGVVDERALDGLPPGLAAWAARGHRRTIGEDDVFVVDVGSGDRTVLILHGFPSSSRDWAEVVARLESRMRIITFDLLGYGLSDKPSDRRVSFFDQADLALDVLAEVGVDSVRLVSHDVGQTVAAELMMRQTEGRLPVTIESSLVTNGSTLVDLAALSPGQEALLSLPDEPLAEPLDLDAMRPALSATFAGGHQPADEVIDDMVASIRLRGGDRLLPRLIRYIEERRRHLDRWTAGLTTFENPLHVAWGAQDPIARVAMAHRMVELRPSTDLTIWDDVSHWPPIEVPERVAALIADLP